MHTYFHSIHTLIHVCTIYDTIVTFSLQGGHGYTMILQIHGNSWHICIAKPSYTKYSGALVSQYLLQPTLAHTYVSLTFQLKCQQFLTWVPLPFPKPVFPSRHWIPVHSGYCWQVLWLPSECGRSALSIQDQRPESTETSKWALVPTPHTVHASKE